MILKARQFGVSTNEIIKLFDYVCFNTNKTVMIMAHEQDSIKKLFRIVKRLYDFMDPRIRPELDRGGGSKYELFFPTLNSRIYTDLESRGDTIHRLHVSEYGFMKDDLRLKATLQAVPLETGHVSIESTPNGMNHFFDEWMDDNSTYTKLFFPWFQFEEYQIETKRLTLSSEEIKLGLNKNQAAYRRFKQAELKDLFKQEYPEDDQTCFLTSGDLAMDGLQLKTMLEAAQDPAIQKDVYNILKPYKKTNRYVCGADTSEGVGGDSSVAKIFCVNTKEDVAWIRANTWKPSEFAYHLDKLCRMYQASSRPFPLLAVERNNHGHAVLLELSEHLHYPNLHHHKDGKPGWVTDKVSRPIMMDAFIESVENETVRINHKETLRECLTLVNNNGKAEAATGKHDDCVIASAIGIQMVIESKQNAVYDNIASKIKL
jgi:hypothetical protein